MTQYILVENRSIVHLHMPWKHRQFQSEIEDLGVDFVVPPTEPGYIRINEQLEIIPIVNITMPECNALYEHLVGPTFAYNAESAECVYTKIPNTDIDGIKNELKSRVAAERYKRENAGTTADVQGVTVKVDTARDIRNIFIQKLLMMSDTDTTNWKFNETWLTISKAELQAIILAGATHIQSQFDWERTIADSIDVAVTVGELQNIDASVFPPPERRLESRDRA